MRINKKDIRLFRLVSAVFCLIAVMVILFVSKPIGFPMLAIGLMFLFTPYKPGDDI